MNNWYAVIIAGGVGTRLWPVSRRSNPKQASNIMGEDSLFRQTVERIKPVFGYDNIYVVADEEIGILLSGQVSEIPEENFIVEPWGKNTAPCIGVAATYLRGRDPEGVMVVLPADHYIKEESQFQEILRAAIIAAGEDRIVTLGIKPDSPSTGYGYIKKGEHQGDIGGIALLGVDQFVEKPTREKAELMYKSGEYFWNSGIFIWKTSRILSEIKRQLPDLYKALEGVEAGVGDDKAIREAWRGAPSISIDYGVMEGAEEVYMMPCEVTWSDLGSWSSVMKISQAGEGENVVSGEHVGIETVNSYIRGGEKLIATIGVKDLIIVETSDALLICNIDEDQKIRDLVMSLEEKHQKYT